MLIMDNKTIRIIYIVLIGASLLYNIIGNKPLNQIEHRVIIIIVIKK
jgi:hypothetical protein